MSTKALSVCPLHTSFTVIRPAFANPPPSPLLDVGFSSSLLLPISAAVAAARESSQCLLRSRQKAGGNEKGSGRVEEVNIATQNNATSYLAPQHLRGTIIAPANSNSTITSFSEPMQLFSFSLSLVLSFSVKNLLSCQHSQFRGCISGI